MYKPKTIAKKGNILFLITIAYSIIITFIAVMLYMATLPDIEFYDELRETGEAYVDFNGEDWNKAFKDPKLTEAERPWVETVKVYFIRGAYEGFLHGVAESATELPVLEKATKLYYSHTGYGNIVFALDQFYNDNRNIKIPVVNALEIIAMEFREESKDKIDKMLYQMREKFSK